MSNMPSSVATVQEVPHAYERGWTVPALVVHGVPITLRDFCNGGDLCELAEQINAAAGLREQRKERVA